MVAEANKSRAAPIYAAASFRSREAVGALVALTRKALIEEFGRELAPLGLNAAQALVIVVLADDGAGTAAEICKHLSHDPGAMTRLIDKLEKMALVRRVRGGEDRRSARLEVTARGKATRAEVTQVQVNVLNRMLRGFSRAEARLLERLLKRMLDNAAELAAE
ncbi:MAG TPA: MarR family transcriptional regulator [Burkholderiales bacterium]|jgi:DNA-binding MarR family transcriptional regulator